MASSSANETIIQTDEAYADAESQQNHHHIEVEVITEREDNANRQTNQNDETNADTEQNQHPIEVEGITEREDDVNTRTNSCASQHRKKSQTDEAKADPEPQQKQHHIEVEVITEREDNAYNRQTNQKDETNADTEQNQHPIEVEGITEREDDVNTRTKKKRSKKITIERPSQIEQRQTAEKANKDRHKPSKLAVGTKWLFTFIFGVILLACLTLSKISILVLSEAMNNDPDMNTDSRCRLFVKLQILILVPNVFAFFKSVWAGTFRNDLPMPSLRTILYAVPVSVFESTGLCLLIFNIPGLCKTHHIVLLMNCVFFVPLLDNIVRSCKQTNRKDRKRTLGLFGSALFFEIGGIAFSVYLVCLHVALEKLWMPIIGILLLSFAWTPFNYRVLLETENSDRKNNTDIQQDGNTLPLQADDSHSRPTQNATLHDVKRITWKLTLIMSFIKICSTYGISMILLSDDSISPFPENSSVTIVNYSNGWKLSIWEEASNGEVYYFVAHICSSFVSYYVGYMACTTCMQIGAFALPLVLTIVPSLLLLTIKGSCESILLRIGSTKDIYDCIVFPAHTKLDLVLLILAGSFFLVAQVLFTFCLIWENGSLLKLKEDQLFWLPMYTPSLLEQWLMLIRRNEFNDDKYKERVRNGSEAKVIICTTMFREDEHEMKQILESIFGVLQTKEKKHYESHIIFDGATKGTDPTEHALQLIYLIDEVFELPPHTCEKRRTPYGMSLKYTLRTKLANNQYETMDLTVHMKDNIKVKSKKRWSQVMYMSYVLDRRLKELDDTDDEDVFILTTDADVKFTSDSIAYLLDLMVRDDSVGAVCARTFPLGNGPVVWYQAFEYAIGHWFQKATEHVIGSVLCSPGCFSVYRCKAIREVLTTYASDVEHAFDFLTKDMGEDRWLCTLMVQTGRRIEYCAASENSTHCPETFDEFFKQRRRWVVSTLANMMLLLQQWTLVNEFNHRVSFLFLAYQAVLLFATLIGPSSVVLVICGGLQYSWNWNPVLTLILQLMICTGFTIICLITSSKTQLTVAKILTFLYAAVMTAVTVGTALQISNDFNGLPGAEANFISHDIKISTPTVYLATVTGIFLITAVLHLQECIYVLHGIWYLMCLPAGYLLLIIYSICNITDRSWGTREGKYGSDSSTVYANIRNQIAKNLRSIFSCCLRKPSVNVQLQETKRHKEYLQIEEEVKKTEDPKTGGKETSDTNDAVENTTPEDYETVNEWLPAEMIDKYGEKFIENGYENEMFISSMTDNDLQEIGIKADGERLTLLLKIRTLPDFKIAPEIPTNLSDWLHKIGLEQYKANFMNASIKSKEEMEALKLFGKKEIINQLHIVKRGHVKRLLYAIEQMRQPTKREKKIEKARTALLETRIENCSVELQEFWTLLIELCLVPQSSAFGSENTLKEKLSELRNTWLVIFALSNILWLILIFTLAEEGHLLSVFGGNPVGFIVIVLFGFILIIQFLAMFLHRFSTFKHFLARAPYFRSSGKNVIYDLHTKPYEDTEHSWYNNSGYSPP
ncbi:uncharacterized protein LOC123541764 isoform X2 [Mercenaria mercenaria]|uniref:uncharacterized protein LOC123541764 isoform X2 n=1 Tax=Mercenaria mercenaria TaxID=6596 RepID=UPI00234EDF72|nr:uncharacterized protein LOC123541764 isoform X2 [Mercenaria mercenaria]